MDHTLALDQPGDGNRTAGSPADPAPRADRPVQDAPRRDADRPARRDDARPGRDDPGRRDRDPARAPGHEGEPGDDEGGDREDGGNRDGREGDRKPGQDEKKEEGKQGGAQDNGREGRRRKRRPIIIVIGLVILAALIGGGVWYWLSGQGEVETDDAYTDGTTVNIAPKVSGYVVELLVSDNTRVKAGDLLMRIDPRDYVAARDQAQGQYNLAQAQLENAKFNLELARATFPARLRQAEAQREQARAQAAKAEADLRRQKSVDPRATTGADVDAAVAAARSANATLQQQTANVEINQPVPTNINLAEASVKQSEAQVAQAKAQLDQAELNLSYTEIRAPMDGWVTKRNVYLGNYVQPGGSLFSLVSPNIWVSANFKETQLNHMRPGQRVRISVDAYPWMKLTGHVDSVQMGSGSRFSAFPAENATGNFVKIVQRVPVKIVIDGGTDPNTPLPLGLSVTPTVEVGQ